MNKRYFLLALATLLIGLLTGTVASGSAQTPLTETYTWQPHGLAIHYPADWTVVQKDGVISLRPADRDVTDGHGPELILFNVPGANASNLDTIYDEVARNTGAIANPPKADTLAGYEALSGTLVWADPSSTGMMTLVVLDDQSVIGVAYVVRAVDAPQYKATLLAIRDSLAFERAAAVAGVESSASVASVQLPQRYVWQETGLVLYLPESWTVDLQVNADSNTLIATPDPASARGDDLYHLLQGVVLDSATNMDLQTVAAISSNEYGSVSDFAETTVAGQPGITYDALDTAADLPLHLRPVFVSLPDGRVAMLMFSTRDAGWDRFRPAVSAIISSIEPAARDTSATVTSHALISRRADAPDQSAEPQPYVWEEYGISFNLPDGWVISAGNGQDYDLAMVSPEAIQNNGVGAFITLRGFPGLATAGNTFEAALQPIADQLAAPIETQTINDLEIYAIRSVDESQGAIRRFILVPYGTRGDAIYIQTTTPTSGGEIQGLTGPISGGDDVVQNILDSMTVNVITPDYDAVDAAWQTSLAEQGRLIVGDADAPVKIREYLSYTCPHCVHYSRSMERMIALDVETGRVQYEFAPLGGDAFARNAALATFCAAEQGKGYSASELLFQDDLEQSAEVAYAPGGVREILSELDLDMDALDTCLNEERYLDNLNAIATEFSDQGLTGTPTVAIGVGDDPIEAMILPNGQVFSGAIPLQLLRDIFTAVIDDGMTVQEYLQQ